MSERIGPYEVIRPLGKGGMAVVLEVQHVETGGRYALKRLDPELANNEKLRGRFTREARALASLDHPNVVGVHAADLDGAVPYFVQPLLCGGTLQDLVRVGKVPFPLVHRLMVELAEGLAHAHERGVLHRDLKPENVLIDERQHAQLSDFGLAHVGSKATPLTKTGEVLGTPVYMAPEQARDGSAADARSDVYGLGGVLYALLTGQPPFESQGQGLLVLLSRIQDEPPPLVRSLRPDVPEGLVRVCERALSKDPARRPASARAFLAELRAAPPAPRIALAAGLLGIVAALLALALLWALRTPPLPPSADIAPVPSRVEAPPPPPPPPPPKPPADVPWTGDLRVVPLLAEPAHELRPRAAFSEDGLLIYDGRGSLFRSPLEVRRTPANLERVGEAPTTRHPWRTLFHVHQGVLVFGFWEKHGAKNRLQWISTSRERSEVEMKPMSAVSHGKVLAVANYSGGVQLYGVKDGTLEPQLRPLEMPRAHELVFKSDTEVFVVGEVSMVGDTSGLVSQFKYYEDRGWLEGKVRALGAGAFRCLALHPNGELLVAGDNIGWLQELSTEALQLGERWVGKPRRANSPVLGSHPNATLRDCAFVAGGRRLLSLAEVREMPPSPDQPEVRLTELRVWDPRVRRETQEVIVFEEGSQSRLAVSSDLRWALFSTRSQIYLVEVR